ncbi:hypothetical protein DB29_04284 [Shouchella clausii]|nr:hypothetical protein DB29_04284 [Shouchella clausii]
MKACTFFNMPAFYGEVAFLKTLQPYMMIVGKDRLSNE